MIAYQRLARSEGVFLVGTRMSSLLCCPVQQSPVTFRCEVTVKVTSDGDRRSTISVMRCWYRAEHQSIAFPHRITSPTVIPNAGQVRMSWHTRTLTLFAVRCGGWCLPFFPARIR